MSLYAHHCCKAVANTAAAAAGRAVAATRGNVAISRRTPAAFIVQRQTLCQHRPLVQVSKLQINYNRITRATSNFQSSRS